MKRNVLEYLEEAVGAEPNKIAVCDWCKKVTYKELQQRAYKIATNILDIQYDVNQPIIVMMNRSADAIASFFGIVYSRNSYVPLDPNMPQQRFFKIFDTLESKILITDSENYEKVYSWIGDKCHIVLVDDSIDNTVIRQDVYEMYKSSTDVEPLYIMFTSGSTGVPKGVVISHRAVIDLVDSMNEITEFETTDSILNQAPFYFDASVPDLYCSISGRVTLHLVRASDYLNPNKIAKYIEQNKISTLIWVPSAMVLLANGKVFRNFDMSSVKKVVFCGEVLPAKYYNIWKEALPTAKFVNYYGPTEVTYACTYYIVNRSFKNEEALPIGIPCRNTEILILNDKNEKAKKGEVGELCVKGTCLALGYYKNEEQTRKVFVQNPCTGKYIDTIYRTGDLARVNSYGELEYVGRVDNQIKLNGYRIELGEVECAISAIEGIENSCCIFDSHKQQIVAFYVTNENIDIDAKLEKCLPQYMMPSRYIKLEQMYYTPNGKIDRVRLTALI